jgi:anaerobic selenocysteine-containing dehydrogenase
MLTTGARTRKRFNSQYLDCHELVLNREPLLEINSIDAEIRGIKNRDHVSLRTVLGEIVLEARVTTGICQGTVHAPFGGGSRRHHGLWRQAHVNSIIPSHHRDPISGYPVVKAVVCEVAKVNTDGDVCNAVSASAEYVESRVTSTNERDIF